MDVRVSLITLGVGNLKKSKEFYQKAFGWSASSASNESVVFFKTKGAVVALFGRESLADDAKVDSVGRGFRAISLAHNVATKTEVAKLLKKAEEAGAKITKQAQDVFWGGHAGYFADPDGHLWEVAWNPHFPLDANGELKLP